MCSHILAYHEAFGAKLALRFATRLWSMRLGSSAGVSLCLCWCWFVSRAPALCALMWLVCRKKKSILGAPDVERGWACAPACGCTSVSFSMPGHTSGGHAPQSRNAAMMMFALLVRASLHFFFRFFFSGSRFCHAVL